jgi:hypothetical protein
MSDLINVGLIRRKNGKYFLTSFGRIVYEAQELIGKAVQYSSKFKAIDSLETSEFPAAERNNIIDTLINNGKIKDILGGLKYNKYIPEKEIAYNKELIVPALAIRSSTQFNP